MTLDVAAPASLAQVTIKSATFEMITKKLFNNHFAALEHPPEDYDWTRALQLQ